MSLKSRISQLQNSPQAKKLTEKAQKIANDPKNREKIENAKRKLNEKRGKGSDGPKAA